MPADSLTPLQRQIYWSAPAAGIEHGRRRTAFGLLLVLGCERLLREGRLRGPQARLAAAQAQAARLLAVSVTGSRWVTRRGDVLRRDGDELAAALAARAVRGDSPALALIAACDLLEEISEWLVSGELLGAAAPAAVDRLRVAQVLLREHCFDGEPDVATSEEARLEPRPQVDVEAQRTPGAWQDDD